MNWMQLCGVALCVDGIRPGTDDLDEVFSAVAPSGRQRADAAEL